MNNIYVLCPYGLVTGGSDALHQLVYYLNKMNLNGVLVYCDINNHKKDIPVPYQSYCQNYQIMKDIIDDEDNAIIVPETLSYKLDGFKNVKKYIWWLSVDNNTNTSKFAKLNKMFKKLFSKAFYKKLFSGYYSPLKIKDYLKNKKIKNKISAINLCASYYALDYVKNHIDETAKLFIEPISKYFIEQGKYLNQENREDIVLYNPKKGYKFTKKLIKANPDVKFVPLKGYSFSQLKDLYRTAKVYIDFGEFPGAERIPKEACINGCAIITGKRGASAFYQDVCLPDEYKFVDSEDNIKAISSKIHEVLLQFDNSYCLEYAKTIEDLESNFEASINEIFGNK